MGNVILGLLLLGPNTLYGLNQHFAMGVSLFYRSSLGSLSGALARLLSDGAVTVEEGVRQGRRTKTYTITESGEAAFFAWLRSPLSESNLETAALSRLYFLGHLAPAEREPVLRGIVARIEADAAVLDGVAEQADASTVPPEWADIARYRLAALEYGRMTHRVAQAFFARLADEAVADDRGSGGGATTSP